MSPHQAEGDLPIFIEAKSAGDFANTNKRRKEEAQKFNQLRKTYGEQVKFILFLCGYFDTSYLGYEAAEGIDWVWEHRIDDLAYYCLSSDQSSSEDLEFDKGNGGVREPEPEWGVSKEEQRRRHHQQQLDIQKTQEERNKLGQFATPPKLAKEIMQYVATLFSNGIKLDFLEPALGTGVFFSALLDVFPVEQLGRCNGFEIDPHYGHPAREIWEDKGLTVELADFTGQQPPEEGCFNLIVTNPPYVRHHHLTALKKRQLQDAVERSLGFRPSGLTGLYVYFIYLAHQWLRTGGIGAWLIPTEFMYVNYGKQLREYLLSQVTLLHIHIFDPKEVQFDDALVSSSIVCLRKQKPSSDHQVMFTYGGTILEPKSSKSLFISSLRELHKWPGLVADSTLTASAETLKVRDLFVVKRGLATGANKFFIVSPEEASIRKLPAQFLIPVLPSPRYIDSDVIQADENGFPDIKQKLFLVSCDLPPENVKETYPTLWKYYQEGLGQKFHEGYLCKSRVPWYSQEYRKPAPIVCSYMGRGSSKNSKPFKFMLNRSNAITTNVYLNLYPKPILAKALQENPKLAIKLLEVLNSVTSESLIANGRTYGGGLHKLEPGELANVKLVGVPSDWFERQATQYELFA